MAHRVSSKEVRDIVDTDLLVSTTEDLTAFITAANLIVTSKLGGETSISAEEAKEIERWLSAHFVAIRSPGLRSQKLGDGQAVYQIGYLGRGLEATRYGQQVMLLDTTGILARLGKRSAKVETLDAVDV